MTKKQKTKTMVKSKITNALGGYAETEKHTGKTKTIAEGFMSTEAMIGQMLGQNSQTALKMTDKAILKVGQKDNTPIDPEDIYFGAIYGDDKMATVDKGRSADKKIRDSVRNSAQEKASQIVRDNTTKNQGNTGGNETNNSGATTE